MLRIGILGTRGIPNHYGGFEQLAEYLSVGLAEKGYEVFVYNSHNHPYSQGDWNGVKIIHCFNPEHILGTAGQFIYDWNCTLDARQRNFDVLLILGYTSSSVWGWLYPNKTVCINHMDGLEWKRQKYGWLTKQFLKGAERLAVVFSQYYISDSLSIQRYLEQKYAIRSAYIAYGGDISCEQEALTEKQPYYLLIARLEKENNIEMILDGMHESDARKNFLVVGSVNNRFGKYLVKKYSRDERIQFRGSIYDKARIETLKQNCDLYFHGHSVGGTNPSLIEAMSSGAIVCAHRNSYNQDILGEDGYYFESASEIKNLIEMDPATSQAKMRENNWQKIKKSFNWPTIIDQYEQFINACYNAKQDQQLVVYKGLQH